jgi:predicted lipid-binding transport protein (Tim44 family)
MQTLFSGWNFARWLRLAAGLIIGILSIRMQDELGGFIAALFLFQAVANIGCCSVKNYPEQKSRKDEEVEFEEVKG